VVDAEISRMLREAEERSISILREHRDALDRLVALLIANETVDGSVVYSIAGRTEPVAGGGVTVAPDRTPSTLETAHVASGKDIEGG
jgi:cell division protease FtsH